MLKYPCLILDHDDTVVQSESTINYPYFCYILDQFRPGTTITLAEYLYGCYHYGFAEMCRNRYHFTEDELLQEYTGWKEYIKAHIPSPYKGIETVIKRQKEAGGILCVVSHSSAQNINRDYRAHFGIIPDMIYGWDLPEHQRKPNPYPLEQIMKHYHLTPTQMLVVDDLKPAYAMASSVGVPIAFAKWSKLDQPEISTEMSALCNYTFESPRALEEFLFDV